MPQRLQTTGVTPSLPEGSEIAREPRVRPTIKITASQERDFYDAQYAYHLQVTDDDLRTDRNSMRRDLALGGCFYERRMLYGAVFQQLLSEPLARLNVLDYGCGLGEWGVFMATEGARATLLDLSPVAIEIGLRRAAANGVADRVRGVSRDAGDLSCFADAEFDLIYASAALHHTLKYPNALAELVRVLRPGGKLILAETYGNNQCLNWLRRARWRLSLQPEEAGEDIILGDAELDLLRLHFRRLSAQPMNLLAMGKRLFRGHFDSSMARETIRLLEAMDRLLLRLAPSLGRFCGEVLVVAGSRHARPTTPVENQPT